VVAVSFMLEVEAARTVAGEPQRER
jgi:hypothetical protein